MQSFIPTSAVSTADASGQPILPVVSGRAWHGVRYFCTTVAGGVSQGGYASLNLGLHTDDDPVHVHQNRQRLRTVLPDEPFWLRQVHGAHVADADAVESLAGHDAAGTVLPPVADAAVSCQRGRVLAILTADCLPVVMADRGGNVLGVAHAGWRGLAAGVLEQTLMQLRQRCPQADGWRAWIGPGIGPQAFEVGGDVFDAFVRATPEAEMHFIACGTPGKWLADLAGLAVLRLHAAGVESVEASGLCTFSEPQRFYSHRRRPDTGRMTTCAWLCDE